MKRNNSFVSYLLVFVFMLINVFSCFSQEKEMPLTSTSKEAVKLFKEGRILSQNFQRHEALVKFDKALELDSKFAMVYLYKSFYGGDYNERMANIEKAIKLVDQVTEGEKYFIFLVKARYDSNEGLEREYLDKLVGIHPEDKHINVTSGYYYYWRERYEEALKHYKKALEIDKDFAPAINMMGYTNMKLKQYEESEKYYKKYIELLPDNAGPYDSYADFLITQDRYDESIEYFKKALEKDKSYYYSLRRIGDVYILKKDYNNARKYYQKYYDNSLELRTKFSALNFKARSYLYENNKENALKAFDEYIQLAVENKIPYYEIMGNAYQGYIIACYGEPGKGLKYYDKALNLIETADLNEDQRYKLKMNASLWKCFAFIELNDFEKSESELENCKNLSSKLKNTYFNDLISLFSAYKEIKQKNYESAISILEKLSYKHPLVYYYFALAYEHNGDKDKAQKYYKKMINIKERDFNLALYYKKAEAKLAK